MKHVFLDIDGVLNSSRSVIVKIGPTEQTSELVRELARLDEPDGEGLDYGVKFGLQTVDPVCVALLNKLLMEAHESDPEGVNLVLSSTHRKFLCHSQVPFGNAEHLRRLRKYLTAMGVKIPGPFSVTPVLHKARGHEIETWVNMSYENGNFDDYDTYVILDDAADMLDGQPLVLVDSVHGFSFNDYAEACKHLALKAPGLVLL